MVTKSGSVSGVKVGGGGQCQGLNVWGRGHGQRDGGQGLGSWGKMLGWVYCGGRL